MKDAPHPSISRHHPSPFNRHQSHTSLLNHHDGLWPQPSSKRARKPQSARQDPIRGGDESQHAGEHEEQEVRPAEAERGEETEVAAAGSEDEEEGEEVVGVLEDNVRVMKALDGNMVEVEGVVGLWVGFAIGAVGLVVARLSYKDRF